MKVSEIKAFEEALIRDGQNKPSKQELSRLVNEIRALSFEVNSFYVSGIFCLLNDGTFEFLTPKEREDFVQKIIDRKREEHKKFLLEKLNKSSHKKDIWQEKEKFSPFHTHKF